MCGFVGFLSKPGTFNSDSTNHILHCMANSVVHRGPDSAGYWLDPAAGIALGHRRLAVVDLSPNGSQPMVSSTGRYIIGLNGEIYNHQELRRSLKIRNERELSSLAAKPAITWRGQSDTETLLMAIEAWGLEGALEKVNGMFAFGLWDRELKTLTLCRDRFGEKPLYYGWQGRGSKATFMFASDLAAFKRHPEFLADIDRDSLSRYMCHNCIGEDNSIYKDIKKLAPGHLLSVSLAHREPRVWPWYSTVNMINKSVLEPFQGTAEEAADDLHKLLLEVVGEQMVSDVPLGAFLSGGVDSSLIVALMQSQSQTSISTYSIGFHEPGYDEAAHAQRVAKHLNTNHNEVYVTSQDALNVIPDLPKIYTEPFADSSQIPTYLVSKLARQDVTVSLSGDAGDELFCGYNRYQFTDKLWRKLKHVPLPIRDAGVTIATAMPSMLLDGIGSAIGVPRLSEKLVKARSVICAQSIDELYLGLVSHWSSPDNAVLGVAEAQEISSLATNSLEALDPVQRMMAYDFIGYLPNDILVKVDRAAMSLGLETRVPFLDRRIVEFAWSLPLNYKLKGGVTKWPLREVLYRYVPPNLIERPKMGFGLPIGNWLRTSLRGWAEDLLDEQRLRSDGYFNPAMIRKKWSEHLSGQSNWQYHLWDVLVFQSWLESHRSQIQRG